MTDDRDARHVTLHVRCPICHKTIDSILTGDTWGDCIPGDTGCANVTVHDDAMGEHVRSEHTVEEMTEARRLYAERWAEREGLNDETSVLISRQADLLTRTVNILRGDPPPLTSWSHHDIPELAAEKVSEVARLTAERDALAQIKRHIDEVRDGTGWTVQIYGVLLQQCDEYGKTVDAHRAERAEAERDALAAAHARESEKVWKVEEVMDDIEGSDPTTWERLRAALAGSEADTTDTQTTDQEADRG